jgi:hypothetical protein
MELECTIKSIQSDNEELKKIYRAINIINNSPYKDKVKVIDARPK